MKKPEMATVGPRLRRCRQQRGLSLRKLAELAGTEHVTLSRLETGKRDDVYLSTMIRVARVLGISLDHLAGTYDPLPLDDDVSASPPPRRRSKATSA